MKKKEKRIDFETASKLPEKLLISLGIVFAMLHMWLPIENKKTKKK